MGVRPSIFPVPHVGCPAGVRFREPPTLRSNVERTRGTSAMTSSTGPGADASGGPVRPLVVPTTPGDDRLLLPGDLTSVGSYVAAAQAGATREAYARDMAAWATWCTGRSLPSTPPADPLAVAAWLAWMADQGHSPR